MYISECIIDCRYFLAEEIENASVFRWSPNFSPKMVDPEEYRFQVSDSFSSGP